MNFDKNGRVIFTIPVVTGMIYCWIQTVITGALLFDTFVLYPNIFSDVPKSLSTSMAFLSHASPGSFFPPLGASSLVIGLAALWFWRGQRQVFYYFLTCFLLVVAFDFIASALYFWPRNAIMFTEGMKVHDAQTLITAAGEFRSLHWVRVAGSIAASFCAMTGLVAAVQHVIRNCQD